MLRQDCSPDNGQASVNAAPIDTSRGEMDDPAARPVTALTATDCDLATRNRRYGHRREACVPKIAAVAAASRTKSVTMTPSIGYPPAA